MAETKHKSADSLRTPKAKKKLGLSVPPALRMPHDDLIPAPSEAISPSMPSQTGQTSLTTTTSQGSQPQPHAPTRDFSKVPNSLAREVIPSGEFKGKSKQLYDCLYSLTRGAVVSKKTVRISRPKLMKRAGIGSRATFDSNIEHLCLIGLLEVRQIVGEHDGNEYTVILPEERTLPSQTSHSSQTSLTGSAQKLDRLVRLETSQTRHTTSPKESTTSGDSKTSFKTNTERSDDDEAFARLRLAMKEATGREVTLSTLAELDELLAIEFQIAASRTTVSSAPAFLAEHLRRRLFKKDKRQIEREAAEPQSAPTTPVDKTRCPDCGGSGYFYPEGYDKGVARCDHKQLRGDVTP